MSERGNDPFDRDGQEAAEALVAETTRLARLREVDDFKWLMGHRQGRRIMWRLLDMSGVNADPHIPGADDDLYRIGQQVIGRLLIREIDALCPEQFTQMRKEFIEWSQKSQQHRPPP